MPLRNFAKGGGKEKLNYTQEINVVAENQISIGDTIYTVKDEKSQFLSGLTGYANTAAFSPDGSLLVLGGNFAGKAKIYSVSGTTITYVSDIYADNSGTVLDDTVYTVSFSLDGTKLAIGGKYTGKAKIYSVSGTTATYISDIYADNSGTALSGNVNITAFSPDSNTLILGGAFTGYAKLYSVSGTTVTYVSDIYADNSGTALSNYVNVITYSPDGTKLIVGGNFTGFSKIYTVSGTTLTYISDIYDDNSGTALSGNVRAVSFNPAGNIIILGGHFSGYTKLYTVNGVTLTFVSNIYADNSGTALSYDSSTICFSPDGKLLVLGGSFIGYGKVYTISGTTVTFVSNININLGVSNIKISSDGNTLILCGSFTGYARIYTINESTVTFNSYIYANIGDLFINYNCMSLSFSPDGTKLVLGGLFTGYAKLYSVSGTVLTFISDIYADNSGTALNGTVYSVAFSPDGSLLVLGGHFTGYVKLYSVSGTTLTFVSNIYADSGTTLLSYDLTVICFSPDGTKLVLGGQFTGYAKIYSVSGTTVTFVSNIYADSGTTALQNYVIAVAFSPDGTKLVLGGVFAGKCKLYTVSGTTVTYISDIYADSGTTALSSNTRAVAFSPDGATLILGGEFTGYAKIYTVSGTTVTFVSNIYADNSNTALSLYTYSITFSPDGATLILGGIFSGKCKIYNISGTTLTFISNIYSDNSTGILSDAVYTSMFTPDHSMLIIGGYFAGYANVYSNENITHPVIYTNLIKGVSSVTIPKSAYSFGYSNKDIPINTSGTVISLAKIIS